MNQTIGHIQCPLCHTPGEVRRYKGSARGSLYWACQCGQIRPATNQKYIRENAEFYPDAGDLVPTGAKLFTPPPKPEKPVTEKPAAAPPDPVAPVTAAPATKKPATKKPVPAAATQPKIGFF